MTRWYRHPKKVKNTVHRLQEANQLDLVLVSDQEQAHLVPTNASVPVIVYVHDFSICFLRPSRCRERLWKSVNIGRGSFAGVTFAKS